MDRAAPRRVCTALGQPMTSLLLALRVVLFQPSAYTLRQPQTAALHASRQLELHLREHATSTILASYTSAYESHLGLELGCRCVPRQ